MITATAKSPIPEPMLLPTSTAAVGIPITLEKKRAATGPPIKTTSPKVEKKAAANLNPSGFQRQESARKSFSGQYWLHQREAGHPSKRSKLLWAISLL